MALSYADPALPKPAFVLVRAIEAMTGARFFNKAYERYRSVPVQERRFWHYVANSLKLNVETTFLEGADIPADGPLVIVANHPYGIVDGASIASTITAVRDDLRIMIWDVVDIPDEFARHFLPLDLSEASVSALKQNVHVRRQAIAHLKGGGSVLIFPSGAVENTRRPWSAPFEGPWTRLTAKLVKGSKARILPVHVGGHNSRLFHVVSHFSGVLRSSLYLFETRRKSGKRVPLTIGPTLDASALDAFDSETDAIAWLREQTLALGTGLAGVDELAREAFDTPATPEIGENTMDTNGELHWEKSRNN